ncbi:MAG: glycerol-3-phosphate 1-O-acyltransferase PlsY [Bacillota bacterium]|nr:glycerol-3-phosphate 1-O-acyltransferase PlsY [Bacillota bacterium]
MGWGKLVPLVILSYFLGSIPFGYLVGKFWKGVDVRRRGSGNIGATNVLRVLGPGPALVVLAGDVGKGALSVYLGQGAAGTVGAAACGIAAAVGGAWSVFLRFGGGKGMGVGSGIVLASMPLVALVLAPIWVVLVALTRYVSLGSVVISALAPLVACALGMSGEYILLAAAVGGIALVKHGSNIKRLIAGQERKLGEPAD